jgi:hypothetical protein
MRHSFLLIPFSALSLAAVSPLAAQQRVGPATIQATAPRGTIDGAVSDTGLSPLQGAFVSILGTNIRVGTGPNGRFRITRVPEGRYLVIVKRVGYRPTSDVVDVTANDTARVAYTLQTVDVKLNPVVVAERAPTVKMAEFEARMRLGQGEFMTQEEIKARNSVFPTELFRKFKSVNVSPSRTSVITEYYALSAREGGNPSVGACPMQIYVDRVPLTTPFNLDLLPQPKDIFGIEVYAGSATIPPEFNGLGRTAAVASSSSGRKTARDVICRGVAVG